MLRAVTERSGLLESIYKRRVLKDRDSRMLVKKDDGVVFDPHTLGPLEMALRRSDRQPPKDPCTRI